MSGMALESWDVGGMSQEAFARKLARAWSAATSLSPSEWSESNPALGQCAVSAVLAQNMLGGALLRGRAADGRTHYWNRFEDGREVDFTEEQFVSPPTFLSVTETSASYVLSYPTTLARFLLLREAFSKE